MRTVGILAGVSVILLWPVNSSAAEKPDFSGTWQINLEASDPVRDEITRRLADRRSQNTRDDIVDLKAQGEAFGGTRTSNRQPRNDDRLGGLGGMLGVIPLLREALGDMERLTVVHADDLLTYEDAEGAAHTLRTNGVENEAEDSGGTVRTKWKGSRLVTELRLSSRSNIRWSWTLLEDGRLELKTRISPFYTPSRPVPPLVVRTIYDRVAVTKL